MNASFESLFIFLLSKLRLPQVYCEPVDGDKSYIARSITLVRHKKRGTALCRLRAASNFQCVGILPYRSLPTKKNPPHPKIATAFVVQAQHRPAATFRDCQECGGEIAPVNAFVYSCARNKCDAIAGGAESGAIEVGNFRPVRRGCDFRCLLYRGGGELAADGRMLESRVALRMQRPRERRSPSSLRNDTDTWINSPKRPCPPP